MTTNLAVAFIANDRSNRILINSSQDTTHWSTFVYANNDSRVAPGAAVFKSKVWLAFVSNNDKNELLVCSSDDGLAWPNHYSVAQQSKAQPGLCVFNNKLWLAFIANDSSNTILVCSSGNGVNWSANTSVNQYSSVAPSLCAFNGKLWLAFTANDSSNRLLICSSSDGTHWSDYTEINQSSKAAPSLCVFNNKLWLAFTANDSSNRLLICSSSDGTHWSDYTSTGQTSALSPYLAAGDDTLCLGFIGDSSRILTSFSSDGTQWSGAIATGQTSKASPALLPRISFTPPRKVSIYSDTNYNGAVKEFGLGAYTLSALGIGNDKLSSLRVPEGWRVALYEHDYHEGRKMLCVRDTPYVGDTVNDRVSSLIVEEITTPYPIFYTESDYQGWSHALGEGSYDMSSRLGNDKLSSVIVPEGYKVTLFEDSNYSGKRRILIGDAPSLGGFNDRTTTVTVKRMTAVNPPTKAELETLIRATAPHRYEHPDDEFRPSSVEWFLDRADLVHQNGSRRPASQAPLSSETSGGDWLQLRKNSSASGDASTAVAYVNAKCNSKYWIDLQYWFFYPYNGAGTGTLTLFNSTTNPSMAPMGEHGGDWEHCTFRVELATQELLAVYVAQHSGGTWLSPSDLQFESGIAVVYSSKHGHATYPSEGSNITNGTSLKGGGVKWLEFGLRNDTAKSSTMLDCRTRFQIIGSNYLGSEIETPSWLSFPGRWGPYINYGVDHTWQDIRTMVYACAPNIAESEALAAIQAIYDALPEEAKSEIGPTGPRFKGCWLGDE